MSKPAPGSRHDYDGPAGHTQEELDAQQAGPLPKPGGRHNASGIPVSDEALVCLLMGTRAAEVLAPCPVADCEACNELHLIWWDCCNALSRTARLVLQGQLVADGYGLPDAPWEDLQ